GSGACLSSPQGRSSLMTEKRGLADYPLAEKRPETVRGARGIEIGKITIGAIMAGEVTMDDLRITPEALRAQAQISNAAGRESLARNFERAAELVNVPQDIIMETYEMLRPGRVAEAEALIERADRLERDYGARLIAAFLREAADIYSQRGFVAGKTGDET
ncbi:MAG: diol dehydratase small subunit, partial [Paracoccaceae bacterium]